MHGAWSLFVSRRLPCPRLAGWLRSWFFTAEREPWRAEAEKACLKSGAVRETAELVRIDPISGPGVCGAEFPLKVAALGESNSSLGYADDLRPPASIGNQPRWPVVATAAVLLAAIVCATAASGLFVAEWRAERRLSARIIRRADVAERSGHCAS